MWRDVVNGRLDVTMPHFDDKTEIGYYAELTMST